MSTNVEVLAVIVALTTSRCFGLVIEPCGSSKNFTQLQEKSKDALLSCSGLNISQPGSQVVWKYKDRYPEMPEVNISTCARSATGNWSCDDMVQTVVDEFSLKSHVIIPEVFRDRLPDGTWSCQNGDQVAECRIDVVSIAERVYGHVTIDEDSRVVSGECETSKMFSSEGVYTCQWFEKLDNQTEVVVPSDSTNLTLSNCNTSTQVYLCAMCTFSKALTQTHSIYEYRVVINPGNIRPSVAYTFKPYPKNAEPSTAATSQSSGASTSATVTSSSTLAAAGAIVASTAQLSTTTAYSLVTNDEPSSKAVLYTGIGIGAGIILAVAVIVGIIVCCVFHRRDKKQKTPDVFGNGATHELHVYTKKTGDLPSPASRPQSYDCINDVRNMERNSSEYLHPTLSTGYSGLDYRSLSLNPTSSVEEPASSNSSHHPVPVDNHDDSLNKAAAASPQTDVRRVPTRAAFRATTDGVDLPSLPQTLEENPYATPDDVECELKYDPSLQLNGPSSKDAGQNATYCSHIRPAQEEVFERRIGVDLPPAPCGKTSAAPAAGTEYCEPVPPSLDLDTRAKAATGTCEVKPGPAVFSHFGFQEKGADYTYFNNGTIPISIPM